MLTEQQRADYESDGFLLLKGAISEAEISRLEQGLARNPPLDGTLTDDTPNYPAPGRYTLACPFTTTTNAGDRWAHP